MTHTHAIGDKVRLIGSREPLTVTDCYWLRESAWYGVKTPLGHASVAVRENQIEAYDAPA